MRIIALVCVFLCLTGCAFAATLRLPESLKIIDAEAFNGDTDLDEVILPDGMEEIGPRAFANSGLRWIHIPESVTTIANNAFEGTSNLLLVDTPANSNAYQWANSRYVITNGVGLLYYTYISNLMVGSEFDLAITRTVPSSYQDDISFVAISNNLQIDSDGHAKVLDTGTIQADAVLYGETLGTFHADVLPVFEFHEKGSVGSSSPCTHKIMYDYVLTNQIGTYIPVIGQTGVDGGHGRRDITFEADTIYLNAENMESWTVSVVDGEEWITLKQTSGTERIINLPDVYETSENVTGSERIGHIKFSLGKYEYVYEITQPAEEVIEIDSASLNYMFPMIVGLEYNLTLDNVIPFDAIYSFSSSDQEVIQVSPSGTLKVLKPGSANIQVISGEKLYSMPVTIPNIFHIYDGSGDNLVTPQSNQTPLSFDMSGINGETDTIVDSSYTPSDGDLVVRGIGVWTASVIEGGDWFTLKRTEGISAGSTPLHPGSMGNSISKADLYSMADPDLYDRTATVAFTLSETTEILTFQQEGTSVQEGDFTFSDNGDGTCTLIDYRGTDDEIVIPSETENGLVVTIIGDSVFANSSIINVMIPDSIKIVESMAFYKASGLNEVILPEGLLKIGSKAFANTSIRRIYLPSTLINIAADAFSGCDIIGWGNDATYAERYFERHDMTYYGGYGTTFKENGFIFSIAGDNYCTIKKYIGNEFYVLIPVQDSLGHYIVGIDDYAFYNNANIIEVWSTTLNIRTIGQSAFEGCTNLERVTLWDYVEEIDETAFSNCPKLTLCSNRDTFVQNYANLNGIPFVVYGETEPEENELADTLTAQAEVLSSTSIKITYSRVKDAEVYYIYFSNQNRIGSANRIILDSWTPIYTFNYLTPNSTYYYWVSYVSGGVERSRISLTATTSVQQGIIPPDVSISDIQSTDTTIKVTFPNVLYAAGYKINYRIYNATNPSDTWYIHDTGFIDTSSPTATYTIENLTPNTIYELCVVAYNQFQEVNVSTTNKTTIQTKMAKTALSGKMETLSGLAIEDAYVTLINPDDESEYYLACSDHGGNWVIDGLYLGTDYNMYIWHTDYSFSENNTVITADGSSRTFLGEINAEVNHAIQFSMKQNNRNVTSIEVGTCVDFEVNAPNASYVRLVADGKLYEAHTVSNGVANFSRLFSSVQNGVRVIQIQSYDSDDKSLGISAAINLSVTSVGNLKAPLLPKRYDLIKGSSLDVSWAEVNGAQYYAVYVYNPNGTQVYPDWRNTEAETENSSLARTIPANVFNYSGKYSVQVVATGVGYDSATGVTDVNVYEVGEEVVISLPPEQADTIGVGESAFIRVDSCFAYGEYSFTLVSSDPNHSVIHDNIVTFQKAGIYELVANISYENETYTSNVLSISVVKPEVILAAEVVEKGIARTYHQYCWELVNSEITFRVKTTFVPHDVMVMNDGYTYDSTMVEKINDMEYIFSIVLDQENVKEEYEFTLTDIYGNMYGPYSIPVYVMENNPGDGNTLYLKPNAVLYDTPEQVSSQKFGDYINISICEGKYNHLILIKYKEHEYFVDANDCITEDQVSGAFGIMDYSPSCYDNILYIGQPLTFTITANEGITEMQVVVSYIPAGKYGNNAAEVSLAPVQCEHIAADTTNQFITPELIFDQCGQYCMEFIPKAANGNELVHKNSEIYWCVKAENERTVYMQENEYDNLWKDPQRHTKTDFMVSYSTPLIVLGDSGNNMLYVMSETNYGFIEKNNTSDTINQITRRGYSFLSEQMYYEQWLSGNVAEVALGTMYINHFIDQSIEIFEHGRCVEGTSIVAGNKTLEKYLSVYIPSYTDWNDVSYIYIFSHGTQSNVFSMSTDGFITWKSLRDWMRNIHGQVNLIFIPCWGGSFVQYLDSSAQNDPNYVVSLDPKRYTIMTATDDKHVHDFNFLWGSSYVTSLMEYLNKVNVSNGVVKKKDLEDNVTYSFGFHSAGEHFSINSFPQYYGDHENEVFPKYTDAFQHDPYYIQIPKPTSLYGDQFN